MSETLLTSILTDVKYLPFLRYCRSCNILYLEHITPQDYETFASLTGWTENEIYRLKRYIEEPISQQDMVSFSYTTDAAGSVHSLDSTPFHDEHETDGTSSEEDYPAKMSAFAAGEKDQSEMSPDVNYATVLPDYMTLSSSIDQLGLSVRSLNALKSARVFDVNQLVCLDMEAILKIRRLGRKSASEITSYIDLLHQKFDDVAICESQKSNKPSERAMSPEVRTIVLDCMVSGDIPNTEITVSREVERRQLAEALNGIEMLGKDFAFEAYSNPDKILPLIDMLCRFQVFSDRYGNLKRQFNDIPESRLNINPQSYLNASYTVIKSDKKKDFLSLLAETSRIYDLQKLFNDICSTEWAYREMNSLLRFLCQDYVNMISARINHALESMKSEKHAYLARKRSEGVTLQALAEELGVTKERVRQIEAKVMRRVMINIEDLSFDPLAIVAAERQKMAFLTFSEVAEYYNGVTEKTIMMRLLTDDDYYRSAAFQYNKEMNMFMSKDYEDTVAAAASIIDSLPVLIPVEQLDQLLHDASVSNSMILEIIQMHFNTLYKRSGNMYYQGRLSLTDMYRYVLEEFYPNGIKLYNNQAMVQFRSLIISVFGDVKLPDNNRAIDARVADISVLCNRGMYIHPIYIKIKQSLLEKIYKHVQNSGKPQFSFGELFGLFKADLLESSNITNQYFLQGVLKYYYADSLYFSKDTVTNEDCSDQSDNTTPIVTQVHLESIIRGGDETTSARYTDLCKRITAVFSVRFANGFRLDSPIELSRLRRYISDDICSEVSDAVLTMLATASGVLFQGKVYAVSTQTKEQIEEIAEEYFSNGARIIFYEAFYEKNENWLFEKSIVSEDMLKGICRQIFPELKFTQTYFGYSTLAITHAIESEILRVWEDETLLSYTQIAERLTYIPVGRIRSTLGQNNDFIWNSTDTFMHLNRFDITEDECAAIHEMVLSECNAHRYISVMDLPLNEIIDRNVEASITGIHNAVYRACLSDDYDKRGKIITLKDEEIDAYAIIKEYCLTHDACTLEELQEFERDLTGEINSRISMAVGSDTMVRIDQNRYLADKYLSFDAKATDDSIEHFIHGEYAPLRSITTFALFPHCGQTWNLFLLESYVRRFSARFRLEAPSLNSEALGCIVRATSDLTYDEILADAVARSGTPLDIEAVSEFLFSYGYRSKRLKANLDGLIARAEALRRD